MKKYLTVPSAGTFMLVIVVTLLAFNGAETLFESLGRGNPFNILGINVSLPYVWLFVEALKVYLEYLFIKSYLGEEGIGDKWSKGLLWLSTVLASGVGVYGGITESSIKNAFVNPSIMGTIALVLTIALEWAIFVSWKTSLKHVKEVNEIDSREKKRSLLESKLKELK